MKFEQAYLPALARVVLREGLFTLEVSDYDGNNASFVLSWEQLRKLKKDLEEIEGL